MLTTGEKLDLIHTFVSCVAIRGETSIGSVLLVFDSATINWENKMPQTWENSLPHSGKNKCHFSGKVLAVYIPIPIICSSRVHFISTTYGVACAL